MPRARSVCQATPEPWLGARIFPPHLTRKDGHGYRHTATTNTGSNAADTAWAGARSQSGADPDALNADANLVGGVGSIGQVVASGDEACLIRKQEAHKGCYLFGFTAPAHWLQGHHAA